MLLLADPGFDARPISADVLRIDAAAVAREIADAIRDQVRRRLRRRGAVLGLSGGIDSSVTAALCVSALGPDKVLAVFMPEYDSDPDSLRLARNLAGRLGIESVVEDIGPILTAAGCYERRDAAIRTVVPDYDAGWKCKVVLPGPLQGGSYNISWLVVQSPDGESRRVRLPLDAYLGMVAATNMKQRIRKQIEYYHADRLNYAVAGTPNRLEYDQGFFVKNGDGAADFKPIAHLYKSQVYPARRDPRYSGRDPPPPPNHRHMVAGADAGRVLLRTAPSSDGPVPLWPEPRAARRHTDGRDGAFDRAGRERLPRHRREAPRHPPSPRAAVAGAGERDRSGWHPPP